MPLCNINCVFVNAFQDTIFEYDSANEAWIERKEHLETARSHLAAVLVDDSVVYCRDQNDN